LLPLWFISFFLFQLSLSCHLPFNYTMSPEPDCIKLFHQQYLIFVKKNSLKHQQIFHTSHFWLGFDDREKDIIFILTLNLLIKRLFFSMLKLLLFQYRHLYSIVRKALLLLHSFPFLKEKFDHQVFMFLLRKFCLLFFQKSFIQVHSSVTLSKDHWRLDSQLILEDCSSA